MALRQAIDPGFTLYEHRAVEVTNARGKGVEVLEMLQIQGDFCSNDTKSAGTAEAEPEEPTTG